MKQLARMEERKCLALLVFVICANLFSEGGSQQNKEGIDPERREIKSSQLCEQCLLAVDTIISNTMAVQVQEF